MGEKLEGGKALVLILGFFHYNSTNKTMINTHPYYYEDQALEVTTLS